MSSAQVNGIVLREDFKLANKIFNNAFNPPSILGMGANGKPAFVPNPKYDPTWDAVSAFKLTQSELRLEQPLTAGNTTITFPVLSNIQNQAQQFPSEIRLNLQDSFVPTRLGVYVALPGSAVRTDFVLYTYFNPSVFANAAGEETFYNGQLKLMINNQQYVNGWGLHRHRVANQTQQLVSPIAAASNVEQQDGANDGMYPIQPFVLLLGSQNIQLSIQLPAPIATVDAGTRIVLRFEGVLAQNSTVVN